MLKKTIPQKTQSNTKDTKNYTKKPKALNVKKNHTPTLSTKSFTIFVK